MRRSHSPWSRASAAEAAEGETETCNARSAKGKATSVEEGAEAKVGGCADTTITTNKVNNILLI